DFAVDGVVVDRVVVGRGIVLDGNLHVGDRVVVDDIVGGPIVEINAVSSVAAGVDVGDGVIGDDGSFAVVAVIVNRAQVRRLMTYVGDRVVFDDGMGAEGIADAIAAGVVDNVVQDLIVGPDKVDGGFVDTGIVGVGDGAI